MKVLLIIFFCLSHNAQASFFPSISGKTLNGDEFTTPENFEKAINVVVVAFKHSHQEMVDTWLKPLTKIESENTKIKFYEFPVMARMSSWKRWMIYNGMKMGISDLEQRSRTISFHIDKKPFKEALEITNEDNIYLFIVKRDGTVKGSIEGVYSQDKLRSLRHLISNR